jgi:hypothetical protein
MRPPRSGQNQKKTQGEAHKLETRNSNERNKASDLLKKNTKTVKPNKEKRSDGMDRLTILAEIRTILRRLEA